MAGPIYGADVAGTIALLTDSTGTVAASRTDAFGQLLNSLPTLPNPFIYTGREYEPALGLYYYRARYYDPSLGRFLSLDEFPASIGKPAALNRYTYVLNAAHALCRPVRTGGRHGNTPWVLTINGQKPPWVPGVETHLVTRDVRVPDDFRVDPKAADVPEKSSVNEMVNKVKANMQRPTISSRDCISVIRTKIS